MGAAFPRRRLRDSYARHRWGKSHGSSGSRGRVLCLQKQPCGCQLLQLESAARLSIVASGGIQFFRGACTEAHSRPSMVVAHIVCAPLQADITTTSQCMRIIAAATTCNPKLGGACLQASLTSAWSVR